MVSALKAALDDAQIGSVDELYFGNVLPAGQGQAPARQAGFAAGLGEDVPATTLNKMCGSGMKATMIGYDQLAFGHTRMLWQLVVWKACRMRRICCPKCVVAHGLGTLKSWITCSWMGWKTPMTKAVLMGTFAEDCAEKYQFTREAQDEYALGSLRNALGCTEIGGIRT